MYRINYKFRLLVGSQLLSLLFALLLVGCNPNDALIQANNDHSNAPQSTPQATDTHLPLATPTPDPVRGKLVVWHSWAGADGDALTAILDGFQGRYPNLTVETLFVAYDALPQAYSDAVLAKAGPDVMLTSNWLLDDLVNATVVQPLDGMITKEELTRSWPATLDVLRRQGTLYALPTHFETVSLFYNRSLLPTPIRLPKSTSDLTNLAQASPSLGVGFYANLYHLAWGFPAYGARFMDDTGTILLDQSPAAADFLSWLNQIHSVPGSYVDLDYGMLLDRFKKGEFAFFVDGPWAIADLRSALGDNLGVTLLPAGPAGPAAPWLSADGVFLNPNLSAQQQALARNLALYLSGSESGAILANIAHRLPAARHVQPPDDPLLAGFLQQAATAQAIETRPEMQAVWGYGGDMLIKVLNGVSQPADAVREATALINDENGK